MSLPVVAVLGITGAQGSSVADALLKDGKWKVRGLTRDTTKQASKDWAAKGVEMMQGDSTKAEDVKKFFTGAHAVFAITAFWDPSQMGKEKEIGFMNADVAKDCGVSFYIFSSLANVDKIANGKYHVPHFTDKALIADHVKKIGLKCAFVMAAFYLQNFTGFGMARKDSKDGAFVITMPYPEDKYISAVDIDDMGEAVKNVLNHQDKFNGKDIPVYGTHQLGSDYVKQYTEVTGKPARFQQLPNNAAGPEIQQMCDFWVEHTYYGPEHNELFKNTKEALPHPTTWRDYIKKGKLNEAALKPL